jgi:hypothetical protein
VPSLRRDVLDPAQRDPHIACRHSGGERLIRRAIAQFDDDRVLAEDPTESAELLGDGTVELTELHGVILSHGVTDSKRR